MWVVHTNVSFCSNTPLQEAIGVGFEKIVSGESDYLESLRTDLERKKNKLCDTLEGVGLQPIVPQGYVRIDHSILFKGPTSCWLTLAKSIQNIT